MKITDYFNERIAEYEYCIHYMFLKSIFFRVSRIFKILSYQRERIVERSSFD